MDKLVEIKNLTKSFHGNEVLKDVDLVFERGTIYGLYGLNGAGKSTLVNILSGVLQPDRGMIRMEGKPVSLKDPVAAKKAGFATIHQNAPMSPHISVAEYAYLNLSALHGEHVNDYKFRTFKKMQEDCTKVLDDFNEITLDPRAHLSSLSRGQYQFLQIAVAMAQKPKILLLDEPYSMLTQTESSKLSQLFLRLKGEGLTILLVSHDTSDALKLCDRIITMANGRISAEFEANDRNFQKWISDAMSNHPVYSYPYIPKKKSRVILSAKHITTNVLKDVSFDLHKGEILGVAGQLGSGRSALSKALFGISPILSGQLLLNGSKLRLRDPADAIKNKICLVPEDTLHEGIIRNFPVRKNISLANLKDIRRKLSHLLNIRKERTVSKQYVKQFVIKTPDIDELTQNLSAGNQQKVNISKWMFKNSSILIMDDPTQNIDIPSKVEIYNFMNRFALDGGSILFISSDYDELIGMCDRVIVVKHGRVASILARNKLTDEYLSRVINS